MYNPITEDKRTSFIGVVTAVVGLGTQYGLNIPIDIKDLIIYAGIVALGFFTTGNK